jgi:outer membrane lipopolysaccharide assembly protein LptE/RlpB
MMNKSFLAAAALASFVVLGTGCGSNYKQMADNEKQAKTMPVNCATAEGDIRMLQSELATNQQRTAAGVTAVVPISAVVSMVSGTEGTKAQIASGEYNKILQAKITEIKNVCGVY